VTGAEIGAAVALGVGGYLLGAVPFGLVVGRVVKGVDIRDHGSGNIGTANAYRVLGARAGTVVLICDIAKGAIPALLAGLFFAPWLAVVLAALPVIGHMRSIFLRGAGGKGAATGAGMVMGLMWPVFLVVLGVFLLTLFTTRMVSAASIAAAVVLPIVTWLTGQPLAYLIVALVMGALVVIAHHGNIARIFKGTERRFTFPWNRREGSGDGGERPSASSGSDVAGNHGSGRSA
jgi:acyl phosphate:glycerol-3-phosphate acyltransferase